MSTNLSSGPAPPHVSAVIEAVPQAVSEPAEGNKPERPRKLFPPVKDYLLGTLRAIEDDGRAVEERRIKEIVENTNFYLGRQIGYVSNNTFEWVDKQSADDPYQIDNIVQPIVDILETEMSRVKIELKVVPKPARADDPKIKEGAQRAEELLAECLGDVKDAFFTQRENKFSILTGDYYRYTYTEEDEDETPLKVPRAVVSQVAPVTQGAMHVCPECGESVPAEPYAPEDEAEARAKLCPDCLTAMNLVRPAPVQAVEASYDERPCRKVCAIAVDPVSVKISPRSRRGVIDSPYLWWRNRVMKCVVEAAHPDREIPSTGIESDAMKYQQMLEEQAGRASGGDIWDDEAVGERRYGGGQLEEVEYDMVWLDPELYAEYEFQRDDTLPSGKRARKGQKLVEIYPKGMLVEKVCQELLDEHGERKRDRWSGGVYRMIPTSAHGGSISGVINDNKQVNELRNLDFYDCLYNGAGREIYNKGKIEGGRLSGDPTVAIAAENLEEGDSLQTDIVTRLPGTQGIPAAERLSNQIQSSAQNKTGAMPTNLAASSIDVKALGTATGVSAMREAAVGRMSPSQMLRAQVDEEQGYQLLVLLQECLREKAVVDTSILSDAGLRWFLELDVRRDLKIEASPGSWMPVTESQRQAYLDRFLQIASIPNLPRPILEYAAELYKMPVSVDPTDVIRQEAQVRLEAILTTARMVEEETPTVDGEGGILPDAIQRVFKFADAPVDPENDAHPVFVAFYQEWLLSSEARRSSAFERECVRERIRGHREGGVEQATRDKVDAMKTKAPDLLEKRIVDEQQMNVDAQRRE
ncbi:MAG TPA: hypothetical protein VF507_00525, partial [Pyrinomonadaceae bacterium]